MNKRKTSRFMVHLAQIPGHVNAILYPFKTISTFKRRLTLVFLTVLMISPGLFAQDGGLTQLKTALEAASNPPLYVKDVLKKPFTLDTLVLKKASGFNSYIDSMASTLAPGKVFGPVNKVLYQVLAKNPGKFQRISQIFLDTRILMPRFADSLAMEILSRLRAGTASFETLAMTYTMGGETATGGDLGWIAIGALIPQIEAELARRKTGEYFAIVSPNGVHILCKTGGPKEATAQVLLMKVEL